MYLFFDILLFLSISNSVSLAVVVSFHIILSDKMRKLVSFEVIPHCVIHLAIKEKTNTKKGDPNAGYHL